MLRKMQLKPYYLRNNSECFQNHMESSGTSAAVDKHSARTRISCWVNCTLSTLCLTYIKVEEMELVFATSNVFLDLADT